MMNRHVIRKFTALLLTLPTGAQAAGSAPLFEPVSVESDCATIHLEVTGTYRGGFFSNQTPASPPGYDARTERLFVGSVDRRAIDVLDIGNPSALTKLFEIDLDPYGGEPTSVAVKGGIVAVGVKSGGDDPRQPATLVFVNTDGELLAEPIELPGASRIAFAPNGRKLVVTISGGPSDDYTIDPEGAVAVVDLGRVDWDGCRKGPAYCYLDPAVRIADFRAFNDRKDELVAAGVRIYGPDPSTENPNDTASVAQDVNPEGFAITGDSRFAWVSLERNNALAVVDLHRAKVVDILPLGSKDHSLAGSGFDASDKDGAINIENWPVRSFYSPDGTAAVGSGRRTFMVTANEGDPVDFEGFSERVRLKDLPLDPTRFPDAETLKMDENLGQLQVTTVDGDVDNDGDYDEIFMLGSRSFAIWSADGQLIFDSGDDFEQITAEAVPDYFNAPEDENEFDARSDDRGPEPEHLTVGRIGPRTYVFVAFERIGGVIVYDLTDPYEPRFQQYINYRNFDVEPQAVCGTRGQPELPGCEIAGDLEPEGLVFIAARESPIGVPLLAVIHELSDSTTLYRINRVRRSPQQCEAR